MIKRTQGEGGFYFTIQLMLAEIKTPPKMLNFYLICSDRQEYRKDTR